MNLIQLRIIAYNYGILSWNRLEKEWLIFEIEQFRSNHTVHRCQYS